jgi:outer membrane protein assembly factor BamA
MFKQSAWIAAVLLLCSLSSLAQKKPSASQRKAPAPAIRFQGAPQYTQEELLAAAGLTPGARLSAAQVKAHAKLLNDTGLFAVVKFSSDSKGLLFSLTPASQLFPIHLDNRGQDSRTLPSLSRPLARHRLHSRRHPPNV